MNLLTHMRVFLPNSFPYYSYTDHSSQKMKKVMSHLNLLFTGCGKIQVGYLANFKFFKNEKP